MGDSCEDAFRVDGMMKGEEQGARRAGIPMRSVHIRKTLPYWGKCMRCAAPG